MKKWYCLFIIFIIFIGTIGSSEEFRINPSIDIQYNEMIGIYSASYDFLLDYLKTKKFPFRINLIADDTKDTKTMVIENIDKLPKESVSTPCPESNIYRYRKCWFIKYGEENPK